MPALAFLMLWIGLVFAQNRDQAGQEGGILRKAREWAQALASSFKQAGDVPDVSRPAWAQPITFKEVPPAKRGLARKIPFPFIAGDPSAGSSSLADFKRDDKGAERIGELYDSVYAHYAGLKLGGGIMGSHIGNLMDATADHWKARNYGSALVLAPSFLAFPFIAAFSPSPIIPKADPWIIIQTPDNDAPEPFLLCAKWQNIIEKTALHNDLFKELWLKGYRINQSHKDAASPHSWISFVNCERKRIVVADPWKYGRNLKEAVSTTENLKEYAPGFPGCPGQ